MINARCFKTKCTSQSDASQDGIVFFTGKVYQLDEKGHCSEKFSTDGPVKFLFYYESRDIILSVTDSLMLMQHRIDANGSANELSKVCFTSFPSIHLHFSVIFFIILWFFLKYIIYSITMM